MQNFQPGLVHAPITPFTPGLKIDFGVFEKVIEFHLRHGFFGVGDVSPWLSATIVAACLAALSWLTLWLIKSGYKLRH